MNLYSEYSVFYFLFYFKYIYYGNYFIVLSVFGYSYDML